jgi:hypothetical protein
MKQIPSRSKWTIKTSRMSSRGIRRDMVDPLRPTVGFFRARLELIKILIHLKQRVAQSL